MAFVRGDWGWGPEETLTVTFSEEFIALFGMDGWTAVRRAGVLFPFERMCLELVKKGAGPLGGSALKKSDQSGLIFKLNLRV